MIALRRIDHSIELEGYDPTDTLEDLIWALDAARRTPGLRTASCHLCGECCGDLVPVLGIDLLPLSRRIGADALYGSVLTLPDRPDMRERRESIASLTRDSEMEATTASLIYEYNNAEPVTFRRHANGVCTLQHNLLCTIYGGHPTACRFYLCNMAERLSVLYENVVRQGVWHSYVTLGWISESDVPHNPFLGASSCADVRLSTFDVDLSGALEALFFYF